MVAGSENGHVVIWDVATKALIADLSGPLSPVIALAVSGFLSLYERDDEVNGACC